MSAFSRGPLSRLSMGLAVRRLSFTQALAPIPSVLRDNPPTDVVQLSAPIRSFSLAGVSQLHMIDHCRNSIASFH